MRFQLRNRSVLPHFFAALALGAASASLAATSPSGAEVSAASPVPEPIAARDAWRVAEAFADTLPGCEAMLGRGDSMRPLYPDGTVLVVRRLPLGELRRGMTVIFIGDRGRPVAHALVKKTAAGWIAQGLANGERDDTLVRERNYVGAVIRAFAPVADSSLSAKGGVADRWSPRRPESSGSAESHADQ